MMTIVRIHEQKRHRLPREPSHIITIHDFLYFVKMYDHTEKPVHIRCKERSGLNERKNQDPQQLLRTEQGAAQQDGHA